MPFEISQQPDHIRIRLTGRVSAIDLDDLAREVHRLEDERGPVHKLTDLTGMDAVDVAYPEVSDFADRRRTRPMKAPVRSAIVASRPLQIGYARMFQTLNDNAFVDIRLFTKVDEALQWLAESVIVDTAKDGA
ncbi:MAG TPA: STAS/SEC14 domain-containing protein [Povalibacter sp.]|uniref:STAS/SEC14 domain-containing protein n=1 Tax=Povalibacter sp. TaxID=1962978 RepID=UPI002C94781A|nr:STAS/SEC14 domain-containing protein [Povalibacter sp.]HMN46556.1 STAS/SEC14 domain-containing protein [Povalibacter sp.]